MKERSNEIIHRNRESPDKIGNNLGSLVSRANFLGYLLRLWLRDRRSYVFLDGKRGGGWEDIEASTCFVLFPRFEE